MYLFYHELFFISTVHFLYFTGKAITWQLFYLANFKCQFFYLAVLLFGNTFIDSIFIRQNYYSFPIVIPPQQLLVRIKAQNTPMLALPNPSYKPFCLYAFKQHTLSILHIPGRAIPAHYFPDNKCES